MSFDTTNPAKPFTIKDPDAILDYTWDLTAVLDQGDTIVSCTFTPDAGSGLAVSQQSNTTTSCTAWLTGGVVGGTYGVSCEFVTAAGRTDDRSLFFKIKER